MGLYLKTKEGKPLGLGAKYLKDIHTIDVSGIDPRIKETQFIVACDVKNPLCGENGASAVYGPQKGATPQMVKELDHGLRHYASVIKEVLGKDIIHVEGTGAAGGLGAGLLVFCNAVLQSGIKTVLEAVNIEQHLKDTGLIITGEGKIDGQSVFGKGPVGIAEAAKPYHIPVMVLTGGIGEGAYKAYEYGISSIMPIVNGSISLEESMGRGRELIEDASERMMRILKAGMLMK